MQKKYVDYRLWETSRFLNVRVYKLPISNNSLQHSRYKLSGGPLLSLDAISEFICLIAAD